MAVEAGALDAPADVGSTFDEDVEPRTEAFPLDSILPGMAKQAQGYASGPEASGVLRVRRRAARTSS
jgi:hypothetical protein